jgi:hypothetical protein
MILENLTLRQVFLYAKSGQEGFLQLLVLWYFLVLNQNQSSHTILQVFPAAKNQQATFHQIIRRCFDQNQA